MESSIRALASSTPTLETPRLVLKRILPCDAPQMYAYAKCPSVTRYLLWEPHKSLKHTKKYIDLLQEKYASREFYDWGVHLKENDRFIGTCGFAALDEAARMGEIGYVFAEDIRKNGYATEAVQGVLLFAFKVLQLKKVIAKYMYGNEASCAVMLRCGMHPVGVLPEQLFVKGEYRTILQCEITRDQWGGIPE